MKKGEQKFGGPPPPIFFFKSELSEMARTLIEKSKGEENLGFLRKRGPPLACASIWILFWTYADFLTKAWDELIRSASYVVSKWSKSKLEKRLDQTH
jgi:hypothetical protein